METLRKTVAALFAILFILTALVAQFLFNLERRAFSPQTYVQAFANENFYERLPSIMAQSFVGTSSAVLPVSMQGLSQENWENFFRDLLPPETLKVMGDQALDSILAYINDQSDTAVLSLAPLKERLAGDAGTQAVLNMMRTQPLCTLEEMARIAMAVLTQQELSLCNPPEDMYPLVIPLIQGQLQATTALIPNEVVLAEVDPVQGDQRQRIQFARFIMRLSPAVPLVLLLLVTAFAVRSLSSWLNWWGFPFLVVGITGTLVTLLAAPLTGWVLLQLLSSWMPAFLPSVLLANGSELASAIVDQMLQPTLIQGIIFIVVGGMMLVIAYILKRMQAPG